MKLVSGSQSQRLAKSIAANLGIHLSLINYIRFGDSEIKPIVNEDVRGETVVVIASTSNPVNESYMEFFLLCDALCRSAAQKIIAVMPYYGYARQNQQHLPGEPVSAHVMAKFIQSVGVDELITVDLHEEQITGFFDIPVTHLSALPILAEAIAKDLVADGGGVHEKTGKGAATNIVVVSPDQGAVERTRTFRDAFANYRETKRDGALALRVAEETVIVEKRRDLTKTHQVELMEISGDVMGKIAIIPDDVIVSGGTILQAARAVLEKGAQRVYLAATHVDFIDGTVEKLKNAPVANVFVTDTVAIREEWRFPKLKVVSIGEMVADKIKKM